MLARNSHQTWTVRLGINCSNDIVRAVYYPFLCRYLQLINITIKFEKLNLKIMEQLLKVMKDESNDRYIFIAYDEGNIVGINFHQGITKNDMHIDYYYAKPCPYTTETFLRMINNTPIYKKSEEEIYEIIKNAVEFVSEVITYTPKLK